MTMNDETRAALVEELAAALYQHDSDKHGIVRLAWDVPVGPRTDALKDDFRETAQGLMPIIDRIKQEAYARGQRDAYNDAAKDMKDMERDFRAEIQDAYREGAESGREW